MLVKHQLHRGSGFSAMHGASRLHRPIKSGPTVLPPLDFLSSKSVKTSARPRQVVNAASWGFFEPASLLGATGHSASQVGALVTALFL
jgi:hypothetical protein